MALALMHSVSTPGVTDLSRQLMRLTLLSRNFASLTKVTGSLSPVFTKPDVLPSSLNHGPMSGLLGGVRSKFSKRPNLREERRKFKDDKDAVHCYGFSYYPRFPEQKDPPIEPTKLFAVKRIRSLYGCPIWEKKLIKLLGLEDRRSTKIFINTPSSNSKLHKVKHLIQITPITFPYGMPDKPENGFLKENGELISHNPLSLHGENVSLEMAEKDYDDYYERNIDGETMRKRLSTRWYSRYDIV